MASQTPALILLFCFSLLIASSDARSPATSTEDDATNLTPATLNEEDVSDLKPRIVLFTESQLNDDKTDAIPSAKEEHNQPESGKFSDEFVYMDKRDMKPIDDGEKENLEEFRTLPNWRPMNRHYDRMRPIVFRHGHRGSRFARGPQIWPRMPSFPKEEHHHSHHHHRHHHGEIFSKSELDGPRLHEVDPAKFARVDGDGRMISEFKQPHFFFRRHHHHHHHRDDEDKDDEEMEHHRHRIDHGFWKPVQEFFGIF